MVGDTLSHGGGCAQRGRREGAWHLRGRCRNRSLAKPRMGTGMAIMDMDHAHEDAHMEGGITDAGSLAQFIHLTVSALLLVLGIFGIFLNRKNVIVILMSIELILLAVNLNLVALSAVLE